MKKILFIVLALMLITGICHADMFGRPQYASKVIVEDDGGYYTGDNVEDVLQEIQGGDVAGPGSSTDNAVVRFDGTGGKTLQNSGVTIDDSNKLSLGTANIIGENKFFWTFIMTDPDALQTADSEYCLRAVIPYAYTVTQVNVTHDADPGTELDANLSFCDAFIGQANTTTIVPLDTTNGVETATAFSDATVPANKCLMIVFDAAPDATATQVIVEVIGDWD